MKILITGKTSRIAQSFIDHMNTMHPGEMEMYTVSLRDDKWKDDDWSDYDAVLHLVGVTEKKGHNQDAESEQLFYHVNRNLATEAARKAKASGIHYFLYASTMMVYGESAPIGEFFTIDTDTKPNPVSIYGKSKYEGENRVLALTSPEFQIAIVREPVVYGEHFDGEFNKLMKLSEKLPFFPSINSTKSYIYEGNLCECFRCLILKHKSGIFCPQNREMPTTSELYQIMRSTGSKRTVEVKGLKHILMLLSHVTSYINAVFNDMKYTNNLSRIEDIDYCIYSLEESVRRCRK